MSTVCGMSARTTPGCTASIASNASVRLERNESPPSTMSSASIHGSSDAAVFHTLQSTPPGRSAA